MTHWEILKDVYKYVYPVHRLIIGERMDKDKSIRARYGSNDLFVGEIGFVDFQIYERKIPSREEVMRPQSAPLPRKCLIMIDAVVHAEYQGKKWWPKMQKLLYKLARAQHCQAMLMGDVVNQDIIRWAVAHDYIDSPRLSYLIRYLEYH